MNWYALFVETGAEDTTQKYLKYHYNDKIMSVVPKRKVPEKRNGINYSVLKKLFPGYVLLNADMDDEKYHVIKQIPKVIKILGNGRNYSPINENEISVILKLVGDDGVIDYSKIYLENSIIHVKDGPLKGFEGLVKKFNKHTNRAKIQINFMGEPRLIDVGAETVYVIR